MRITGQVDGDDPPKQVRVLVPGFHGLTALERLTPSLFGAKDAVEVTSLDPAGTFTAEIGWIYHISLVLLPPMGVMPAWPAKPPVALRFGDEDEIYVIAPEDNGLTYRVWRKSAGSWVDPGTARWKVVAARFETLNEERAHGWALDLRLGQSRDGESTLVHFPAAPKVASQDNVPRARKLRLAFGSELPPALDQVTGALTQSFHVGLDYDWQTAPWADVLLYVGGYRTRDLGSMLGGFKAYYLFSIPYVSPFLELGAGLSVAWLPEARAAEARGGYHLMAAVGVTVGKTRSLSFEVSSYYQSYPDRDTNLIGVVWALPVEDE